MTLSLYLALCIINLIIIEFIAADEFYAMRNGNKVILQIVGIAPFVNVFTCICLIVIALRDFNYYLQNNWSWWSKLAHED